MRASPSMLLPALVSLAFAGGASGARLPWEGELSLELLASGLPPIVVTGTGVATLNTSGGGSHLASVRLAGGIEGSSALPVTDPEVVSSGIVAFGVDVFLGTATLGVAATPSAAPQLTRSTLPVVGVARLCLFDPACLPGGVLSLPLGDGSIGVGVGGLLTVGGSGPLRLSLVASPWTVGTALVTLTTNAGASFAVPAGGWLHGALSFTTSTALPGGAFSLVTPVRVSSNASSLAGFGRLTVRFVPEPGALALLGSGLAALLALARRRLPTRGERS